ncbi:MAG: sulfatase [Armatimonadetes bacterium]|nr:sulfatase [Armatimonadota bacterium]
MTKERKEISRREFITRSASVAGAALLGTFPSIASCAKTDGRKPNVIFLFADQMRNASLGCMGNTEVHTPNMDKLARQGLLFKNAISGYPLCSPYRAMLLTGRYGTSTGVVGNSVELPNTEITIAKVLKEHGYKTGFIGKWHLEKNHNPFVPKERRLGFDYWASRNLGGSVFDDFYCTDTPDEIHYKGFETDIQTNLAINFIKKNAKSAFCLFVAWRPPHPPREVPQKYLDMFDPKKLTQRPNVPKGTDDRENLRIYYAQIAALDYNIGRITKVLDDLGIADDTIVCFSSDHGDMLASHGLQGKNVPYEESINIPFIMRYPRKIKAGQKTDILLNSVDVMPTLLGLCEVPIPKSVQGLNLSQTILGKSSKKPESVFLQRIVSVGGRKTTGEWRGVRTSRYTYARFRDKGYVLFDNIKDPCQMNNLIDKPEAKGLREQMEAELQKWLKQVGDDFAPTATYVKRFKAQMNKRMLRGLTDADE